MNLSKKNNGILYISCGPPGSGKSTFLKEMKEEGEVIVSRDEIRFSLLKPGEEYFAHEKEAYNKFLQTIKQYINSGVNVYADATHLTEKSRYTLIKALKNRGCFPREINAIYFIVPLDICKERNELRRGTPAYVPIWQVEKMFTTYVIPNKTEGFSNIWKIDSEGDVEIMLEGD